MRSILTLLLISSSLLIPTAAQAQGLDKDKLEEIIEKATEKTPQAKNRKERPPKVKKGEEEVVRQVRRALDRRDVTVNFVKTEFVEVVDFLRDVTGLNIVLSKQVKKEFGEKEITLRVKKIRLRACLNLILDLVSEDLRYGVKHGVLWIGHKDEWKKELVTKILYVGDIISPRPNFKAPKLGLGKNGIEFSED